MDTQVMVTLGKMGGAAALGLAATGSALGAGAAGVSGVGAWKKCFAQNRPAPFLLLGFIGAPLSQTIYGFLLMRQIADVATAQAAANVSAWPALLATGVFGGLAIGMSAWTQGQAAAGACDSFGETGKGFANNMIVLGVIESVAIFTLVFASMYVGAMVPK